MKFVRSIQEHLGLLDTRPRAAQIFFDKDFSCSFEVPRKLPPRGRGVKRARLTKMLFEGASNLIRLVGQGRHEGQGDGPRRRVHCS